MSVWCIRRLRWTLNMWLWLRIHHKANHTAVKKNLCAGDKSVKTIFTCQNQPCTAEPLAMFFFLLFSQNKNVQIVFKDRESSVGLAAIWQEWQWINGCTVQFCIHTCLNASLHTYTPLKSSAHRYANRIIVKRKKKNMFLFDSSNLHLRSRLLNMRPILAESIFLSEYPQNDTAPGKV